MHNYTYSMTRNSDAEFIAFPFRFEITVNLPASELWQEWENTHSDHTKSWLWPLKFSQPSVEPCPAQKGGLLTLTYQIPNPHDSSKPPKNATYQFHILAWDPAKMYFKYAATDDHPFLQGGGALQISPLSEEQCSLVWEGEYRHVANDSSAEAQGDVFVFFLAQFFNTLAQNVKKKVGF